MRKVKEEWATNEAYPEHYYVKIALFLDKDQFDTAQEAWDFVEEQVRKKFGEHSDIPKIVDWDGPL